GGPGGGSGSTGSLLTPAPSMRQRIDLGRLAFLQDGGTHRIQVFIADRNPVPSPVRFATDISTLNLAGLPRGGAWAGASRIADLGSWPEIRNSGLAVPPR